MLYASLRRGCGYGADVCARAEPRTGADAQKRPLRSRFRARLTAGVRWLTACSGDSFRDTVKKIRRRWSQDVYRGTDGPRDAPNDFPSRLSDL